MADKPCIILDKAYILSYETFDDGEYGRYNQHKRKWVLSDKSLAYMALGALDCSYERGCEASVEEIDVHIQGNQYRQLLPFQKFDMLDEDIQKKISLDNKRKTRDIWYKIKKGEALKKEEIEFFEQNNSNLK